MYYPNSYIKQVLQETLEDIEPVLLLVHVSYFKKIRQSLPLCLN